MSGSVGGTKRCEVREVELRIQQQGQSRKVEPATLGEFENLAGQLEAVWIHPDSDARLKKRIVRTLIEEVVVDVDSEGGEIIALVHCWWMSRTSTGNTGLSFLPYH